MPTRTSATLAALAASLALSHSCAEFTPERTEPNLSVRCRDEDTDPRVAVSFRRDILEGIIQVNHRAAPGCSCHLPSDPEPVGRMMSGLDLSTYVTLRAGGNNTATNIVVPGRPCGSALYLKVTASPPLGARMPRNGPPHLSDAQIKLIHDWIAEGAREN